MTKKIKPAPVPERRKLTPEEIDAMYTLIEVPDDFPEVGVYEGQLVNVRRFLAEHRTNRYAIACLEVDVDLNDGRGKRLQRPWKNSDFEVNEYGDVSVG